MFGRVDNYCLSQTVINNNIKNKKCVGDQCKAYGSPLRPGSTENSRGQRRAVGTC